MAQPLFFEDASSLCSGHGVLCNFFFSLAAINDKNCTPRSEHKVIQSRPPLLCEEMSRSVRNLAQLKNGYIFFYFSNRMFIPPVGWDEYLELHWEGFVLLQFKYLEASPGARSVSPGIYEQGGLMSLGWATSSDLHKGGANPFVQINTSGFYRGPTSRTRFGTDIPN